MPNTTHHTKPRRVSTDGENERPKNNNDDNNKILNNQQQHHGKNNKRGSAGQNAAAVPPGRNKRRKTASTVQRQQRPMPRPSDDTEALPYPLKDPATNPLLAAIETPQDRHLQVLLWEIDCHYTLLPHQFRGVRALAGVSDDFPGLTKPPTFHPKSPPKNDADSDNDDDVRMHHKQPWTENGPLLEWVVQALQTAKPRLPGVATATAAVPNAATCGTFAPGGAATFNNSSNIYNNHDNIHNNLQQQAQQQPLLLDRGILMADVMGLGKTVQAIAACMLRNAMALAREQPIKPTLIVSPNDAVLLQWQETLIKANVDPMCIYRFKAKSPHPLHYINNNYNYNKCHKFFLCNRYDLQTEARYIFGQVKADQASFPKSPLFPNADKKLLQMLKNQYLAEQGKAKNWLKLAAMSRGEREKLNLNEIVTSSFKKYVGVVETVFETVVVDEAHFLKNLAAYWGMAAGLIGLHTNRMIPMTGTPYNNSCQDMATLMTMIDPTLASAKEKWWKQATTKSVFARDVQAAISEWSTNYLIRRDKDAIASQLPKKIIRKKHVGPLPLELSVYEHYEGKFLEILAKFQQIEMNKNINLFQKQKMKHYFEIMLAIASCMRLSLIHPVLADGGRDFSVLFSPSRREMKGVLNSQENPRRCVCCKRNTKREAKARRNAQESFGGEFDGDDNDDDNSLLDFIVADDVVEYEDDNEDWVPEGHQSSKKTKAKEETSAKEETPDTKPAGHAKTDPDEEQKGQVRLGDDDSGYGSGDLLPIPEDLCELAKHGIRHFACETCLEKLETSCSGCPKCTEAKQRLRLANGMNELRKMKNEAMKQKGKKGVDVDDGIDGADLPRKLYCEHILGGFRATAKLESIIEDYHDLPICDKVLICSFFKGSLDLLEGIFDEMGVPVARFDGDIPSDERQFALDRFKEDKNCRVLLMSVQTGGTGLNLVNANHVWFADRYFNPMVMEQCEDRCYRLGQTKDVDVTYHDVSYTTDDVMCRINKAKTDNAKIILTDGTKLSTVTSGMSFNDISGELGNSVRAIRAARHVIVSRNKGRMFEPLPASNSGVFDTKEPGRNALAHLDSILNTFANLLGYPLPGRNVAAPFAGNPQNISVTQERDSTLSSDFVAPTEVVSNDSTGNDSASPPQPDVSSCTSSSTGTVSPPATCTSEDTKPAAVPSQTPSTNPMPAVSPVTPAVATSKKRSLVPSSSMDDADSDNESIPDAVIFGSYNKK